MAGLPAWIETGINGFLTGGILGSLVAYFVWKRGR